MTLALLALALAVDPPAEGHFITDTTKQVSESAKAEVDELAATIHVGGFGELMVLVVNDTGKAPAHKYALEVFSTWPVGHAENVDGALVVLSLKDKKSALVLGDGYKGMSQKDAEAALDGAVAPLLKDGKVDEAVVAGARAVLKLLEKHHAQKDGG